MRLLKMSDLAHSHCAKYHDIFLCHISVSVETGKNSEKIMKCSFTEMFVTKPCTPADCNDKLEFRYLVTHRDVDKEILSKER